MKIGHWLAVIAVLYFGVNGLVTLYNLYGGGDINLPLPDWGSVMGNTGGGATTGTAISAGLDLGTAGAIYFFVLHKKLMAGV